MKFAITGKINYFCKLIFVEVRKLYIFVNKSDNKTNNQVSMKPFHTMSTDSKLKIEEYLESVKDQISHEKFEGYLPTDSIIHAFTKGEEHGEAKAISKWKDEFMNNITQQFLYSLNIYNTLIKNNYDVNCFYISPVSKSTIYLTSVENTVSDDFINLFYDLAFDFEGRFFKDSESHITFSFMGGYEVDENLLECDNYIRVAPNGK